MNQLFPRTSPLPGFTPALLLALAGLFNQGFGASAEHWAYQPLKWPDPPMTQTGGWARTPIDEFVLEGLEARGFQPAAAADKRTLLRRLFLDLTGLPPSPAEMHDFLQDARPGAYERWVDQLLGSPRYGERWARLWMDAVHFAETHGHDQDRIRTNAWPYRDYLIQSFNEDKPYARFINEQIAGDVLAPGDPQATVALGMVAAGPWDESSLRDIREDTLDRQVGRYLDRDDMVTTVMQTFTSTTVQCARCHDHKFDPITQKDYYALQAVFAGVDRANRVYDPDPAVHRRRQELLSLLRRVKAREEKLPPSSDVVNEMAHAEAQIERDLEQLPRPSFVYAIASDFAPDGGLKPAGGPRPVQVLARGNILTPIEPATPGALSCLTGLKSRFALEHPDHEGARRAALARWLTDRDNPLAWRSIVNRVWLWHFGRGLVETPNDFGRLGARPSHPELLDWLAVWFRDEAGGSFKQLHRLLLTSAVWRQSSQSHSEAALKNDSDNASLWRMNARRLDAEQVRDAILLACDRLDLRMGGPSDKQFGLQPGIHVTPKVDYSVFDVDDPAGRRRAVYRFLFRTLPDPFMDALDCPSGDELSPVRHASVTVQHALALWNDEFVVRAAAHFAERLRRDASSGGAPGSATGLGLLEAQITLAFEFVLGRPARAEELREFGQYASRHGLANFCRLLFNSNEFMFVN